jgi:3-oxoacyl-[acyl-carrier-protein] synthase III
VQKHNLYAKITSVGHYVPPDILDNAFFESYLDTSDEWIRTRTGIVERHILKEGATSDMAVKAAQMALERRGWTPDDLELIIVSTVTPDMMFPSTACLVQDKLGASKCWGYDLVAACSSFLFGIETGSQFIASGRYKRVMVIGADKMSAITDYQDRNTCVLFGDAAACVILEPSEEPYGLLDSYLRVDGRGAPYLHMKAGGSLRPPSHETVDNRWHYVFQEGKTVFKRAVVDMAESSAHVVERNGLTGKDIAFLVPHQANLRIIEAARERMGIREDQVMINIQKYGNTTSATIPLCLSEWWTDGKLKKDDYIVLSSFGAGYTWGAILVKWAY